LANDTHIFNPTHVISLVFYHFISQLVFVGLFVQLYKCSAWPPSGLPPRFIPLIEFCRPLDGIRILGIPFGFASFTFFFFAGRYKQGCSTCRCVPKIKVCLGGFWYPLLKFCFFCFVASPPVEALGNSSSFFTPPLWESLRDFWVWAHWSALRPI
jgi:hypothetical protein